MPQKPGSIGVGNLDASGKADVHVGSAYHQGYYIDETQSYGQVHAVYHIHSVWNSYFRSLQWVDADAIIDHGVHHHYATSESVTPVSSGSPFAPLKPVPRREHSVPPAQPGKDASSAAAIPGKATGPFDFVKGTTAGFKSIDEQFAETAKTHHARSAQVPAPVRRGDTHSAPTHTDLDSSTGSKVMSGFDFETIFEGWLKPAEPSDYRQAVDPASRGPPAVLKKPIDAQVASAKACMTNSSAPSPVIEPPPSKRPGTAARTVTETKLVKQPGTASRQYTAVEVFHRFGFAGVSGTDLKSDKAPLKSGDATGSARHLSNATEAPSISQAALHVNGWCPEPAVSVQLRAEFRKFAGLSRSRPNIFDIPAKSTLPKAPPPPFTTTTVWKRKDLAAAIESMRRFGHSMVCDTRGPYLVMVICFKAWPSSAHSWDNVQDMISSGFNTIDARDIAKRAEGVHGAMFFGYTAAGTDTDPR
ncbi:hypothetical protein B0A48_10731 [Cryoendolithus antarcticus]|uniref:Uncharacterized protein n=1 Tax=Cryoendolithus antarcticus TaxID=1507870 RepID=A0A1V8SYZ0_9PEZI|nr:hypothetical protein B0A48_10731 [Cryoendolithus antarcticus]